MGEWSKSIGEKGEQIVKFVFEEILNFNALLENQSISCVKGKNHRKTSVEKDRTTHGIDGLVSYQNPLEDFSLDIGVISSKYIGGEYPKSPSTLFKTHFQDLAQTIECFNNSRLKNSINQHFSNINKTEILGILVWLSNTSEVNFDLISKVNNVIIGNEIIFDKIILVDNNVVNFLYESIYKTKQKFQSENVDFVYHNSGLNISSIQEKTYGKVFPLNYLYSDIIPMRVQDKHNVELHIYVNDDFQEEQLIQILDFSKSFDHLNAIDKLIINYRSYDSLIHDNLVKEKLVKFPNYKLNGNLEIRKFPSDFRNS